MDEKEKAREARAKKYGIKPVEGGALTKPAKYSDVADDDFGDPTNYRYPMTPPERLVSARGYYNHSGQRAAGGYSEDDWRKVGERIAERSGEEFTFDRGQVVRKADKKAAMTTGDDTTGGYASRGAMVALRMPDEVASKMYDAAKACGKRRVKASDMHATLAYLGEDEMDDEEKAKVRRAVKDYAAKMAPLSGFGVSGTGKFEKGEYGVPFYARCSAPGLRRMRRGLVSALEDEGVKMASDARPFNPHVTLAYLDDDTQSPELDIDHQGLSLGSLWLKFGDGDYEEFPMSGETKAIDLGGRVDLVRSAWHARMREQYGENWWDAGYQADRILDDAIICKKGDQTFRCPYVVDEAGNVAFGAMQPVDVTYTPRAGDEGAMKAGARVQAPKLSMLQNLREKLSEAVAQLNQVIMWGEYQDGADKAWPDWLNIDALAAWAEEVKALSVPGLPPMYLQEIKSTPTGVVIGGYMAPFGSPVKRDLQLDYFTPETDFFLENYPKAPAIFHHGKDPVVGKAVLGQRDDAYLDETGLWVQDWVNKSGKFWELVKALLDRKMLYYSPGAVPHLVERTHDRQLKAYPIADDTFTPTPVQAPLLGRERSLDYIKSAYQEGGIELPAMLRGEPGNGSTGDAERRRRLELEMLNLQKTMIEVLT